MGKVIYLADLIARRNRPLIEIERERRAQQREQDRDLEQERADIALAQLSEAWKALARAEKATDEAKEALEGLINAWQAMDDDPF